MNSFRKDATAQQTIERIRKTLKDHNINVKIVSDIDNDGMFYSIRIEFENIQIGTNGKGITREYALASAYAEFMERLQTGLLTLKKVSEVPFMEGIHDFISKHDAISFLKEHFSSIDDCEDNGLLTEMLDLQPEFLVTCKYFDIINRKNE